MKTLKMYIKKYLIKTVFWWIISLIILLPNFNENVVLKISLSILAFHSIFFIIIMVNESVKKKLDVAFCEKQKIPNIKYEREVINQYSPLIAAKLLGKNITNPDVVTAMILYLQEKKLAIKDEEGTLLLNLRNKILEHEKFFIQESEVIFSDLYNKSITKTKYNNQYTYIQYLEKLIYEDMIKLELIEEKNKETELGNDNYAHLPYIYAIINMILLFPFILVTDYVSIMIINLIIMVAVLVNIIIFYIENFYNPSIEILKTEKAHLYTKRLHAQKRYLKEYSLISTREIKEHVLWEHYIKMAIFFNFRGKLDEDAKKYYLKAIEIYGYEEKKQIDIKMILITALALGLYVVSCFMSYGVEKIIIAQAIILVPLAMIYFLKTKSRYSF